VGWSDDGRHLLFMSENRDATALSDAARAGLQIFRGRGTCARCHIGPSFTDEQFHNTGVAWAPAISNSRTEGRFLDDGRAVVTGRPRDRGAFKTPTLREVARTAPYMHDGSLASLEDVVNFYSSGGHRPSAARPDTGRSLSGTVTEGFLAERFREFRSGSSTMKRVQSR
jgi:cytochrome c peroxidase